MSKLTFRPFDWSRWLGAGPAAERPISAMTVRVIEEHIATLDELGNRRELIRIRTLAGTRDDTGRLVEVERNRRHTLPGFGHVYPVSADEYVVYRGGIKLRVDPEAEAVLQPPPTPELPQFLSDIAGEVSVPSASPRAPAVQDRTRRERVLLFSALVLVPLLALALWQRYPQDEPAPPFSAVTPVIAKASSVTTEHEPEVTSSPSAPVADVASLKVPPPFVRSKTARAPVMEARLALAIRPWGEIIINGKRAGISPPLRELRLPPGRYDVEIRNGTLEPHRQTVDLRSNEKLAVGHDFSAAFETTADKPTTIALGSRALKPRPLASRPGASTNNGPFLSSEWPR